MHTNGYFHYRVLMTCKRKKSQKKKKEGKWYINQMTVNETEESLT